MTNILKNDDKIFTMYRQYKELIHKDAEEGENRVYGTDQLAAQLTIAHMLDRVVCLLKEDKPPTVRKVNKTWKKKFEDGVEGKEELGIMRNNAKVDAIAQVTSSSANVDINWGRTK